MARPKIINVNLTDYIQKRLHIFLITNNTIYILDVTMPSSIKCYKEEFMHVDSIAVTQQCGLNGDDANNVVVIVGLSSLEGNIWDGAIRIFSSSLNLNEEEGTISTYIEFDFT